ncbi:MAG: hypothetical protein EPO32_04705 [Anaerolineae bacterium]|nr:MAG: hypothetical protein EPO32_04705 [Anaerolineae bacterium]
MANTPLAVLGGWSAYLSAGVTVLTFITGILFFTRGAPWGRINDSVSVFQLVFMIPIAISLYVANPGGLALVALMLGLAGMSAGAYYQSLIALNAANYEKAGRWSLTAGAGVGAWLILANIVGLQNGGLPMGLLSAGWVAGAAYLMLVAGFWRGGQGHPLFVGGSLGVVLAYPIWAVWLGSLMLAGG